MNDAMRRLEGLAGERDVTMTHAWFRANRHARRRIGRRWPDLAEGPRLHLRASPRRRERRRRALEGEPDRGLEKRPARDQPPIFRITDVAVSCSIFEILLII